MYIVITCNLPGWCLLSFLLLDLSLTGVAKFGPLARWARPRTWWMRFGDNVWSSSGRPFVTSRMRGTQVHLHRSRLLFLEL